LKNLKKIKKKKKIKNFSIFKYKEKYLAFLVNINFINNIFKIIIVKNINIVVQKIKSLREKFKKRKILFEVY